MEPLSIGILGCAALLLFLVGSMPVAFAMAIVGAVGFAAVVSPRAAMSVVAADFYATFTNYNLTVIPLFIFMGQVAFHTGISSRLFAAANNWFSSLRGGLAMATVGACAAFGAICGSGPATAATMAAVALPEMRRYKYDDALASGTVAAGGGLGMLSPPSVVFIVYGILTEQSIGKLFFAGILPGLLVAFLFCLSIRIQCWLNPNAAPPAQKVPWRTRIKSLAGVTETLLLFFFVMGGMFAGFFTPTEGAAIGAFGSIVIAAIGRHLTLEVLWKAGEETLRTSCMVLVIIAGATVFGHFLAVTGTPMHFAGWLAQLPLPAWVIILAIIAFYLVCGCFIDSLALILLTVPILYPVILKLHYDPIWFGVMAVLVTQMGVITPPVGVNAYVVSGIERSIPLQTVFRGSLPFLFALFLACTLLLLFPQIATWLPYSL
ncbi:MAG: TRAP transporter large permease [Kiritimatiellae bacterium]|nr:TRAP transporter large permease [Kiritimatiellia bacterium]